MALVKLLSGKGIELSNEKGRAIWAVMSGELPGTPEQVAFCETVQNIYLNRYNAPASYMNARAHIHAQMDAAKQAPYAMQPRAYK